MAAHISVQHLSRVYRVPVREAGLVASLKSLCLVITWVLPVGFMTTIPAEAVSGELSPGELVGSVVFALALLVGALLLFRSGLRRYTSASS